MNRPTNTEKAQFQTIAIERSGKARALARPVEAAGTEIWVCALNRETFDATIGNPKNGEGALKRNAFAQAIAKARLWPDQEAVRVACEQVPGLAKRLVDDIYRLSGAAEEHLSVVDVDDAIDAKAARAFGVDATKLAALRARYPHRGSLKIASYRDEELKIKWSCLLKLPSDSVVELSLDGMKVNGCTAIKQLAVDCIADVEESALEAFLGGANHIAVALFPVLYNWARSCANARPTCWLQDSTDCAMWDAQPGF